MKITMRSLLAALPFLMAVVLLHEAGASIPGTRFSVRPDPKGSLSPGGDYFVIESRPGAVEREAVELSNPTRRPVDVRLEGVDATTAQLGGVDYSPSTAAATEAGAWIDLDRTSLTIAPGAVATVRFEVRVPEDASPGLSLAGISVWTPPGGGDEKQDAGLDAAVEIQTRRVVAVEVDLPGSARPVLEISGVAAIARPDGVYLQVTMRNAGHGFAEGQGRIELDLGSGSFSTPFALDKVVPRTTVWYPIRWQAQPPPDGSYPATVEVDYGAGSAQWRGEVMVGETVREALDDRGIGTTSGFPYAPVAAGALAVAGVAMTLGIRRWRRRVSPSASPPAGARARTSAPPAPRSGPPPPPPLPPPPPPARATGVVRPAR